MPRIWCSSMAGLYAGHRTSFALARSATRTGLRDATESKHGPSPKVNWSSSYARAPAPLEPKVPLVTPAKISEMAAASMLNNVTQASQIESAAARPRWPSTAARSFSWIATFSRAGVGHRCPCPNVEVARSYLHHPLVEADLRVWAQWARQPIDTSWSIESMGRSPSTIAVTANLFRMIAPL